MKHPRTVILVFVTLLLTFAINLAKADSNPPILPPNSHAYGKSYEEWSAAWMEWVLSIPGQVNPLFDPTGAYAANGQKGKVWFLVGATDSSPVVRTITIPANTPLFFPIVNFFWVNTPETGDPVWSPTQEAFVRNFLAGPVDTAYDLSLQIDGRTVRNLYDFRFPSTVGTCNLAENLFIPEINLGPHDCVADGYWALLPPLSVGSHKIHFTGGLTALSFHLDVTYKITVQPPRRIIELPHHNSYGE